MLRIYIIYFNLKPVFHDKKRGEDKVTRWWRRQLMSTFKDRTPLRESENMGRGWGTPETGQMQGGKEAATRWPHGPTRASAAHCRGLPGGRHPAPSTGSPCGSPYSDLTPSGLQGNLLQGLNYWESDCDKKREEILMSSTYCPTSRLLGQGTHTCV